MLNMYAGKAPISSITDNYDLIIQLAEAHQPLWSDTTYQLENE